MGVVPLTIPIKRLSNCMYSCLCLQATDSVAYYTNITKQCLCISHTGGEDHFIVVRVDFMPVPSLYP